MNLANTITICRIGAIPLFLLACLIHLPWGIVLFVLLALSDAVDGWVARARNEVTELGKLLDPLADKLLTHTAMWYCLMHEFSLLLCSCCVALLWRDIQISTLRIRSFTEYQPLDSGPYKVSFAAKLKSCILTSALVVWLYYEHTHSSALLQLAQVLLVVATFLSLSTHLNYTILSTPHNEESSAA